ncbi:hypothetical protein [Pelagerythrobacter sp.]|uniref:hypothetical protein n=1 Tax=Pelagerythrobacter sp. TaxID=2800702 RepID=UPI0035B2CEFA
MYNAKATTNRDWAKIHLNFGVFAIPCLALLILSKMGMLEESYGVIGAASLVLSMMVMFMSRNADEYTLSLWSAGATAGFMAAVAWLIFAPLIEGFVDGATGNAHIRDWPADMGIHIGIAVFLIAFNLKRFRGTA